MPGVSSNVVGVTHPAIAAKVANPLCVVAGQGVNQILGVAIGAATPSSASSRVRFSDEDQHAALNGLAELRSTVDELVPDPKIAHSLDAKLDATTNSVLALRITPALNQINAFANEVNALKNSGRISPATATIMKTKHGTVKNSISNIH